MSSHFSAPGTKIGPRYETSPISFQENYVSAEFPSVVTDSDYRTLAWILLKVVVIKYIRSVIDKGAVEWCEVKELIRHKDQIIKVAYEKKVEGVMSYLNQHLTNYASLAHIRSIYDNPAFDVYLSANGGFNSQYDPAVYHFTGWKTRGHLSASNKKIGPEYETSPISFEEDYVPGEFPSVVTKGDYRTLAWIILKVAAIKYIRSVIDTGALEWCEVKELIGHKDQIIKIAYEKKEEGVMGYLNQHLKNFASVAHVRSAYDNKAFGVYLFFNGGFDSHYESAVYHFTGWKICRQ